jgi:hypothetical protein
VETYISKACPSELCPLGGGAVPLSLTRLVLPAGVPGIDPGGVGPVPARTPVAGGAC